MDPTEPAGLYAAAYYLPSMLFLLAAALALLDVPVFKKRAALVAAFGLLAFAVKTVIYYEPSVAVDHRLFWEAGQVVAGGGDPYRHGVLNPPTAVPLSLLLARVPLAASYAAFTVVNVLGAFALAFLAHRIVAADGEVAPLAPARLAVLSVAVALSHAAHSTIRLGQLGILVAAFVMLAVLALSRGWGGSAGALLALATIKPGTMLPFLLLPLQKRSWRAFISLGASVLALSLAVPGPAKLLEWLAANWANIRRSSSVGHVNDLTGARAWSIMSLDGAFYNLGITNLAVANGLQLLVLAALGAWIFWQAVWRRRWPAGLVSSILSLYASIFLYHRSYDTVILALPLVYAAIRTGSESGRARTLFAVAMLAILGTMYVNPKLTGLLFEHLQALGGPGRVAWGLVRPYATWLVLVAMGCMAAGHRAVPVCATESPLPASEPSALKGAGG